MKDLKFRLLRSDEIEVRPITIKDGKATMLLYVTSRAVVRLLNETVGPLGWQMEFEEVNGQLVGKMSIWDGEKGMWITKSDTGSESNIEAQKGLFSDCYKRCLSRWGVDELYSSPKIVIEDDKYGNTGYKVTDIQYNDNREIIALSIANRFGKNVFNWKLTDPVTQPQQQQTVETDEQRRLRQLSDWFKAKQKEEGIDKDQLVAFKNEYKSKAKDFKYRNYDCEKLWAGWLVRKQSA